MSYFIAPDTGTRYDIFGTRRRPSRRQNPRHALPRRRPPGHDHPRNLRHRPARGRRPIPTAPRRRPSPPSDAAHPGAKPGLEAVAMIAGDPIVIADWSPQWSRDFAAKAAPIRDAAWSAGLAHRSYRPRRPRCRWPRRQAHHRHAGVGRRFRARRTLGERQMALAGYAGNPAIPNMTKRYFRERPGAQRTHVACAPAWQLA